MLLSILTPAFNEATNLDALYARVAAATAHLGVQWEWLIVDDHSRDDTFGVIQRLARTDPRVRGVRLPLTPVEFRLLQVLITHPGRVHSRNQLLDAIYVDHRVVSDRTVDSHVKNLRRKIADAAGGYDPIQSIYGFGYKFDETV